MREAGGAGGRDERVSQWGAPHGVLHVAAEAPGEVSDDQEGGSRCRRTGGRPGCCGFLHLEGSPPCGQIHRPLRAGPDRSPDRPSLATTLLSADEPVSALIQGGEEFGWREWRKREAAQYGLAVSSRTPKFREAANVADQTRERRNGSELQANDTTIKEKEECQVAEDKMRKLESEAELSASNINRLEKLASELQGRIQKLLEYSTLGQNHQKQLLEKISKLESDNQELVVQVQSIMDEKSNNAESLQGEIAKRDQQVDTIENQFNQLRTVLDEKEQLYSSVEIDNTLEEQKLQVEASLAATECQLIEAKKQYHLMLEGKQIELSRHLVELCLKNDQRVM